ncbi:hypothetical protein ACS0TY_002251 [Phlomoides rotata]
MINLVIAQNTTTKICVTGDFNSIRAEGERCGRGGTIDRRDIRLFDDFISMGGLVDLQLWGRKYTWYKPGGSCKRKLDRIMVNKEWVEWKPDLKLMSLDFCKTKWESYSVAGWKSFSLKEKLILLKKDLKGWSRDVFGGIQHKIEIQRGDIECLDRVDDMFSLEEEEARSKLLKEGDVNSNFFHRWIKANGMEGLFVNEEWVDSKEGIRSAIFSHFCTRCVEMDRRRRRLILGQEGIHRDDAEVGEQRRGRGYRSFQIAVEEFSAETDSIDRLEDLEETTPYERRTEKERNFIRLSGFPDAPVVNGYGGSHMECSGGTDLESKKYSSLWAETVWIKMYGLSTIPMG